MLAANKVAYQSSALMNRVQSKNRYKDKQSECKLSQAMVALALGNLHLLLSAHIAVSAHVQNSYLQFVDGYFSFCALVGPRGSCSLLTEAISNKEMDDLDRTTCNVSTFTV